MGTNSPEEAAVNDDPMKAIPKLLLLSLTMSSLAAAADPAPNIPADPNSPINLPARIFGELINLTSITSVSLVQIFHGINIPLIIPEGRIGGAPISMSLSVQPHHVDSLTTEKEQVLQLECYAPVVEVEQHMAW
jgi:hypothetical protein